MCRVRASESHVYVSLEVSPGQRRWARRTGPLRRKGCFGLLSLALLCLPSGCLEQSKTKTKKAALDPHPDLSSRKVRATL